MLVSYIICLTTASATIQLSYIYCVGIKYSAKIIISLHDLKKLKLANINEQI